MNIPPYVYRLPVPTVLLFLAACALSPQVVTVRPALEAVNTAGAPATVALEVTDMRGDPVIGRRGGVYDTATITAAADAAAAVRAELERVLAQQGHSVAGGNAAVKLSVEIVELGYRVREENVTRTIETWAMVRAKSQSGGTTRTGEYRDRRTEEMLKPPSAVDNAAMINKVLSAALQRLVADPDLLRFQRAP